MSEHDKIARDMALTCTFSIIHRIRHAFREEELEGTIKEIYETVKGAIKAALAEEDEGG